MAQAVTDLKVPRIRLGGAAPTAPAAPAGLKAGCNWFQRARERGRQRRELAGQRSLREIGRETGVRG